MSNSTGIRLRVLPAVPPLNIELRQSETAIQWHYVGEVAWHDLVLLSDIRGPQGPVNELRVDSGYIQWLGDDGQWNNLISVAAITGPTNSLAIGSVTSGPSSSATITGAAPSQMLNLVLQKGDQGLQGNTGNTGPANSLSIGSVTTGAPGSSAVATITGTAPTQTLNLTIPQGVQGPSGGLTDGDKGDITVSGSGSSWVIDPNTITNGKLAKAPALTFKGNNTAVTADPVDMTVSQAQSALQLLPAVQNSYTGLVAGPTFNPNNRNTTNRQMMSRRGYRAAVAMATSSQLVFPNWYASGTAEGGGAGGGTLTLTASIEYPAGTRTQIKFGGSSSTTIAGAGQVVSDAIGITIPKGARFVVRTYQVGTAGILYADGNTWDSLNGNCSEFNTTGVTDRTMSGDVDPTPGTNSGPQTYGPVAIIGPTTKESVLILGDSISIGLFDQTDDDLDVGAVQRSLGRSMATINAGRQGDTAAGFVGAHTLRAALQQYATHVAVEYGHNDILNNGNSAATLKTNIESIVSYFPTKKVFVTTITPRPSSTDSWATIANQTANANDPARQTYNGLVRTGQISGAAGYFDLSAGIEYLSTGKFRVNGNAFGYTPDGIHPSYLGNLLIRDEGVVDPAVIVNPLPLLPKATQRDVIQGHSNDLLVTPAILRRAMSGMRIEASAIPTLEGLTTAGVGTYTQQKCKYRLMGNECHVTVALAWTAHTGTGNLIVRAPGIPPAAAWADFHPLNLVPNRLTFSGIPSVLMAGGTDYFQLFDMTTGGNGPRVVMDTSAAIWINGFYFTDAVADELA